MAEPLKKPEPTLYDRDFYAWTQQQGARLRGRAHNDIDWDSVAEEIESLGRSDKREIASRLAVLLAHLLKWEFQPDKRKAGWKSTIREQRTQCMRLIRESPSLKADPSEVLAEEFANARLQAGDETGVPAGISPERCPYSIDEILDHGFLPGEPWLPETLVRD